MASFVAVSLRRVLRFIRIRWRFTILYYYALKLIIRFPFDEWLDYEEVLALGCSERYSKPVIGALVELRILEARLSLRHICVPEEFEEGIAQDIWRIPFEESEAEVFEYRRIDDMPAPNEWRESFGVSVYALSP